MNRFANQTDTTREYTPGGRVRHQCLTVPVIIVQSGVDSSLSVECTPGGRVRHQDLTISVIILQSGVDSSLSAECTPGGRVRHQVHYLSHYPLVWCRQQSLCGVYSWRTCQASSSLSQSLSSSLVQTAVSLRSVLLEDVSGIKVSLSQSLLSSLVQTAVSLQSVLQSLYNYRSNQSPQTKAYIALGLTCHLRPRSFQL